MSTINALSPGCKCVSGFTASKFTCNLSGENTFVKGNYKINNVCYNTYIVQQKLFSYYGLNGGRQN